MGGTLPRLGLALLLAPWPVVAAEPPGPPMPVVAQYRVSAGM
jgi:hypothetical protein